MIKSPKSRLCCKSLFSLWCDVLNVKKRKVRFSIVPVPILVSCMRVPGSDVLLHRQDIESTENYSVYWRIESHSR